MTSDRVARQLEQLIYRTIEQRHESRERKLDLLSLLLEACDEDGAPLTDREIRDEAITMFAGGTETSASTLAWACYLLACHGDATQKARAEVADAIGDGPIGLGPISRLTYLEKVVKETLRLFPPVWRTSREALETYSLNGFDVRKGKQIVASQYLIHRNPRYQVEAELRRDSCDSGGAGDRQSMLYQVPPKLCSVTLTVVQVDFTDRGSVKAVSSVIGAS